LLCLQLSCLPGTGTMTVDFASLGRPETGGQGSPEAPSATCAAFQTTRCDAGPTVLARLKALCDGKQSCRIYTNDSIFSLPMPNGVPGCSASNASDPPELSGLVLAVRATGCAQGTGGGGNAWFRESLAGFLLTRGPHSWMGFSWIATHPLVWYPEWDVDFGEPLGPMTTTNGVATRQWSKISTSLNLSSFDATFTPTPSPPPAPPTPMMPWSATYNLSRSTTTFPDGNHSGPDNAVRVAVEARYGLVAFGWETDVCDTSQPPPSGSVARGACTYAGTEDALDAAAARLKAINPDVKVVLYRNTELGLSIYKDQCEKMFDAAFSGFYLKNASGLVINDHTAFPGDGVGRCPGSTQEQRGMDQYFTDFRNATAAAWFVDTVVGRVARSPHTDGVWFGASPHSLSAASHGCPTESHCALYCRPVSPRILTTRCPVCRPLCARRR